MEKPAKGIGGFFRRLQKGKWANQAGPGRIVKRDETAPSVPAPAERTEVRASKANVVSETVETARVVPSEASKEFREDSSPVGKRSVKHSKLAALLEKECIDLAKLQGLCWSGIPREFRPRVWKLLLKYTPLHSRRRTDTHKRKRREYIEYVTQYHDIPDSSLRAEAEQVMLRQILVDCARTHQQLPLFCRADVQKSLERVLYIWSVRHPASGYVQGINDLVSPLFAVFLQGYMENPDLALEPGALRSAEADAYWCLSALLNSIQDHYTPDQPGVQKMLFKLQELVRRIDGDLHAHLEGHCLEYMQFAYRWMNCLLTRELSLDLVCRLWDTYLCEPAGFDVYHVFVCAALLQHFSASLKALSSTEDLIQFLQHLPTEEWSAQEVEELLSRAFVLRSLFECAPKHFEGSLSPHPGTVDEGSLRAGAGVLMHPRP